MSEGNLPDELRRRIKDLYGGSLHIRHVDTGSCNGCDFEMGMLGGPIYDLARFGVEFVASPRHADMIMVTGSAVRHLQSALLDAYNAMAAPRLVIAVGACACGGGIVGATYATGGGTDKFVPVDVYIPGCPPRPEALLQGILTALDRFDKR